MQRIFVDFGRGVGDEVDILTTARPNESVTLRENERVILYDSSLEVQASSMRYARQMGVAAGWRCRIGLRNAIWYEMTYP